MDAQTNIAARHISPVSVAPGSSFYEQLASWKSAQAEFLQVCDRPEPSDAALKSAGDVASQAYHRLIGTPAPDARGAAEKLVALQLWSEGSTIPKLEVLAICDDAKRILEAATTADPSAWDAALAEYRKAWALWDTLGEGYSDEESNAVAAVALPAIEAMIDTPAPNAAALAIKIEEARKDRREVTSDDLDAILADVRRLAAMEG